MTNATKDPTQTSTGIGVARAVAVFGSLGAAAIHFASAPNHYAEWWPAGVFFVLIGVAQAGWAVAALVSASRAVFTAGLVINLGVIATWAFSRTIGIPVGPAAGVPEDITRAGLTALAFEIVIALIALDHLVRNPAKRSTVRHTEVVALGAAAALAVGLAVPAVATAMSHAHGPGEGAHSEESGQDDHHDEDESEPRTEPSDESTPDEVSSPPDAVQPDSTSDGHDGEEPHGH